MKSALIYGTCTGKTEAVADKILAALDGALDLEKVDAGAITAEDLTKWDFVICGIPTWNVGQLEYCWQDIYDQLDDVDCNGLKVAMFGLGDQYSYQDTYQDAMGLLYKKLIERQAEGETVRLFVNLGETTCTLDGDETAGEIIAAVNGATPDELPSHAALVVKP